MGIFTFSSGENYAGTVSDKGITSQDVGLQKGRIPELWVWRTGCALIHVHPSFLGSNARMAAASTG